MTRKRGTMYTMRCNKCGLLLAMGDGTTFQDALDTLEEFAVARRWAQDQNAPTEHPIDPCAEHNPTWCPICEEEHEDEPPEHESPHLLTHHCSNGHHLVIQFGGARD